MKKMFWLIGALFCAGAAFGGTGVAGQPAPEVTTVQGVIGGTAVPVTGASGPQTNVAGQAALSVTDINSQRAYEEDARLQEVSDRILLNREQGSSYGVELR